MPSFGASIVLPEFVAHGGHSSSDRVAYLVRESWEDQFPRRFVIRQRLSLSQYLPRGPFFSAASDVKNRRFLRWWCSRHFSSRGFGADDHRIGQFDPMTATKADGAFRNLFVDNNGVKAVQSVARRAVAFASRHPAK
jgi:hypothetical protein